MVLEIKAAISVWSVRIVGGHDGYSAKALIGFLFDPSAKADGNENSKFIAVGFNQRIENNQQSISWK